MSEIKTNQKSNAKWVVLPSASDVADSALDIILTAAKAAIQDHGEFRIVLAGGSTPEQVYAILAGKSEDWKNWKFYLGDERCLPVDDPERNSKMIYSILLKNIDLPDENIHFMPSEKGSDIAAHEYAKTIQSGIPFDLVMLGMGEDGHTASLFPGHEHKDNELVHAVHNAPKPPAERVSLSAKCLSQSQQLLIMTTGKGKKTAIIKWRNGEPLPISRITSLGDITILLDQNASPN